MNNRNLFLVTFQFLNAFILWSVNFFQVFDLESRPVHSHRTPFNHFKFLHKTEPLIKNRNFKPCLDIKNQDGVGGKTKRIKVGETVNRTDT